MSGLAVPIRALLRAAWTGSYNQGWRFSRIRSGLWAVLLQLGVAGLVLWRVRHLPSLVEGASVQLMAGLQAAILAFLAFLLSGRAQLHTGPLVSLTNLSPTPAQAVVIAEVLRYLPSRGWSAFLFTLALYPMLPAGGSLWGTAGLWLAALLGGLLGHLAGLVMLIGLVRRAPRTLVALPAVVMVLGLAYLYTLVFLLALGLPMGTVPGVAASGDGTGAMAVPAIGPGVTVVVSGPAWFLGVGLMMLLGLPGLWLLLALLRRADAFGEAYREGWLGVVEMGDQKSAPRRSRWPRIVPGPVGAVQSLVWLMALRNWFSLVRLGLLAAGLAAPIILSSFLRHLAEPKATLLFLGAGLVMGLFNYGEQAAALFVADGERGSLAVLSGISPGQLLAGKWLAALPLPLVAGLTSLVTALAGGIGLSRAPGAWRCQPGDRPGCPDLVDQPSRLRCGATGIGGARGGTGPGL